MAETADQETKSRVKNMVQAIPLASHQLRHNAATFLRKEVGLETARVILGHHSTAVTEIYAELDLQKAMEAIVKVG